MKADRTIRFVEKSDKTQWDKLAGHPLQSWAWGEFRHAMGIDVVRLGVWEKNKLVDGWQITFHPIPHTPWTIGYFPKGPAPTKEMAEELTKLCRQKNAVFIQLEPNIQNEIRDTRNEIRSLRPSHHPLFTKYTFILNLTKSEDELLAAMHQKARYNIRVAQKHEVKIKEDNSEEAFREYLRLSEETTSRQGFYAHNPKYHKTMWDIMRRSGCAHLFTASYGRQTLAAWVLFTWGDTIYYPYGASSRQNREVMAPNLLLWEIAKWGKKSGFKKFDLWGAMGTNPDTRDPWYGFHRFKEMYKPDLVEFAGSYDLVIKPFLYTLYCAADTVRWFILKRFHS